MPWEETRDTEWVSSWGHQPGLQQLWKHRQSGLKTIIRISFASRHTIHHLISRGCQVAEVNRLIRKVIIRRKRASIRRICHSWHWWLRRWVWENHSIRVAEVENKVEEIYHLICSLKDLSLYNMLPKTNHMITDSWI